MRRFFILCLVFGALALPVRADPPWRGEGDQSVRLADLPPTADLEAAPGGKRVEVEELERDGTARKLRFTMLDGAGARAPILAYLEVTVRPDGAASRIQIDMMQSFGPAGGGTMSDLCRAAALHPTFRKATELSAFLDFTNDRAFRAALRDFRGTPDEAFRSTVQREGKTRTAVPLARHLEILAGGSYAIARLREEATGGKARYRIVASPRATTFRPPEGAGSAGSCLRHLELVP